jgi:hypothetical protein
MQSHWKGRLRTLAFLGLGTAALATGVGAQTVNLDFTAANEDPPASGTFHTYGSIPGVVDVSYRTRSDWGLGPIVAGGEYGLFWPGGYNDLPNVAYFFSGPHVGEIRLDNLLAGNQVTINSADVGAYPNATETVQLRVYDLLGNLLFIDNGATAGATTHAHFTPGSSNVDGLLIQFSQVVPGTPATCPADPVSCTPVDAYNNGINNVNFTIGPIVSAVPEPSTVVLLAGGLVAMAAAARRRRVS